jgi:MULE transposase domain
MTPTNQTFSLAFCLMQNEKTDTYCWALSCFSKLLGFVRPPVLCTDRDQALAAAITTVFPASPHLLCVWHINKNIQAKWKADLGQDKYKELLSSWRGAIDACSKSGYVKAVDDLRDHLADRRDIFVYLSDTWLVERRKFVAAWIDRHLHLGNAATSRVEGAHAALKKWISNSTTNLRGLLQNLEHHVKQQVEGIAAALENERTKTPQRLCERMFGKVFRKIPRFALEKVKEQRDKLMHASIHAPLPPCTNSFRPSLGLPCAHELQRRSDGLRVTDFHVFWRICLATTPQPRIILEPRVRRATIAVTMASLVRADRRDPSGFERAAAAEAAAPAAAPAPAAAAAASATGVSAASAAPSATPSLKRKRAPACCSACGESTHTFRKCPRRQP